LGVLALQGDVAEHAAMLGRLGVETTFVKQPQHLSGLDGLIIPGGESTTIGKLLLAYNLRDPLRERALDGFPIWGTCAGMILLAKGIAEESALPDQPLIGTMDIRVRRNGFGRQLDSFETDLAIPALGERPFRAVFIRAPYIEGVGDGAAVLATLDEGPIVAARQGPLLATAFHPELTGDPRFHAYFLSIVRGH
jgi:5'-phosphate synthase pdxT subunit